MGLNAKQERFAQSLARGMNASAAYKAAGYAATKDGAIRANASRLLTNANVKSLITDLQCKAADNSLVTIESIAAQLDEDRRLAFVEGQASAAVAASLAKARLYGLLLDRTEISATLRKPLREASERREMSLAEWTAKFKPAGLEHDEKATEAEPEPVASDKQEVSLIDFVKDNVARNR